MTSLQQVILLKLKHACRSEKGPVTEKVVEGFFSQNSNRRAGNIRRVLDSLVKKGLVVQVPEGAVIRFLPTEVSPEENRA